MDLLEEQWLVLIKNFLDRLWIYLSTFFYHFHNKTIIIAQ